MLPDVFEIAWKNLVREKTRLAISIGGVAFAVLLILLIQGLYSGLLGQATQYIRSVDADVWVAQAGTPGDFFHSVTLLPRSTQADLERVPGVESVTPLVGRRVVFTYRGKDRDFFLLGVDPSARVGGPPSLVRGKVMPARGEIVIDRVFAHNSGIDIGDTLRIEGRSLRVVGIAKGGNAVTAQFAWGTLADVAALLRSRQIVNYFFVRTAPGADVDGVAAAIDSRVRGVRALTQQQFVTKNTRDLREGFLPIVLMLVVIAFGVGTSVIGLTIYTATVEKRREFGVIKAIGFSNRRLFGIVLSQSLLAGAIGLVVGVALTFGLGSLLEWMLPSFVTTFGARSLGVVAAAAVVMSFFASFLPARRVARVDPAEVFRV